jgi:LPXTG-motif cell wall-anchored protein
VTTTIEILPTRITRPAAPAPEKPDEVLGGRVLPFTGAGDPTGFVVAAGVLMASGGGMLLTARRRRR